MRLQFAAVVPGLTLIPVHVFGCTCTPPTAQVKDYLRIDAAELRTNCSARTCRETPLGLPEAGHARYKGNTGELAQLNRGLAQLTGAGLPVPF
jgi:hypothetical protein